MRLPGTYISPAETGLYYLQSRYYNPKMGRFINADGQLAASDLTGANLFSYCGNNPVNRIDPTGEAWYHWAIGAAIVVGFAALTVATCGGSFALAATSVGLVASGVAAGTTATTVAAAGLIGSATVYGVAALAAAETSSSMADFAAQGNWWTVGATLGGGVFAAGSAYASMHTPTTTVYRSVGASEAQSIKATGQFTTSPYGMQCKQFGFNLSETSRFGSIVGQDIIVSAKLPTSMLGQFYTGGVDTSIFTSGTLTVYYDMLDVFNQAIVGTIRFM